MASFEKKALSIVENWIGVLSELYETLCIMCNDAVSRRVFVSESIKNLDS